MDENLPKNNKRRKTGKSKISFDEEIVTKDHAKQIISEDNEKDLNQNKTFNNKRKKQQKKQKLPKNATELPVSEQNDKSKQLKGKKKPKLELPSENEEINNHENDLELEPTSKEATKRPEKESNRSIKRKKHEKLLQEKKLQVELDQQQKALNYLSKWKHSRTEWKFEKLKQIWLQQNYLDTSKIPEEFWNTAVQYFDGSKGQSRQAVLDQAMKHIEEMENIPEDSQNENYKIKLQRAKDIVQHLQ